MGFDGTSVGSFGSTEGESALSTFTRRPVRARRSRVARELLFFATLSFALGSLLGAARADTGVELGASASLHRVESNTAGAAWAPNVRATIVLPVAGPLKAGAFAQAMGTRVPLVDPNVGGGIVAQLGLEEVLRSFRPAIDLSLGRQRFRGNHLFDASAWTVSLALSAAVIRPRTVGIEIRIGHEWMFTLGHAGAIARAWHFGLGFRFARG
ncbi:MAG: hypothetical protein KF901_04040 [Myxococcales bacterium]|nr:hypothetical protein [Myxococcales bacterium]